MAIDKKLEDAINDQINAELYSAYLYLSMASYFDASNLGGFSNWMKAQAQEEVFHAMKFYGFLDERGGRPVMKAIAGPETSWESPLKAFEHTYSHECEVSARINKLMDLATEVNDHMAKELLHWFIAEQVEEESSADKIVQELKLIGDNGHGLLMIDRELAGRVFTPPASGA
jgi:ferritin